MCWKVRCSPVIVHPRIAWQPLYDPILSIDFHTESDRMTEWHKLHLYRRKLDLSKLIGKWISMHSGLDLIYSCFLYQGNNQENAKNDDNYQNIIQSNGQICKKYFGENITKGYIIQGWPTHFQKKLACRWINLESYTFLKEICWLNSKRIFQTTVMY